MTAAAAGQSPGGRPALPLRPLGRSGLAVTEISFGGAAIGNLFTAVTDDEARAAVDAAWDGGRRIQVEAPPGPDFWAALPGGPVPLPGWDTPHKV